MAKFEDLVLADGTKFLSHRKQGGDLFIFEVKDGHILSISINSPAISRYQALLVKMDEYRNRSGAYGDTPMDAGAGNVRHGAVHELGIAYGSTHDHFGSRRNSVYDGMAMLACLVADLGATEVMEIARMAKTTSG